MVSKKTASIAAIVLISLLSLFLVTTDDSSATIGDTFSIDGLSYEVTDEGSSNAVKVTGFTGETIENLIIPDTVIHGSTYNVTKIGMSAFATKGIKTVDLGNVEDIDELAFSGCVLLTNVTGDAVSTIGASAFSGCVLLKEFAGSNLSAIGTSAFTGCVLLETIDLSGVHTISPSAFMECRSLEDIDLSSVNAIMALAFYDSGITSVSIPTLTATIGSSAFGKCSNLESITVATLNPVFKVENGALVNRLLKMIKVLPQAYEVPGGNYTIANGIEKIDDGAFDGCENLTSITIPSSVDTIGSGIFRNCPNLSTVTVSGGTNFKTVNNCLYSYDGTSIYFVPEIYPGSFVMPAGVTTIEPYCFSDCVNITSVDISNVTDIGTYAFSDCHAMTLMYVNKDASLGVMSFDLGSVLHSVTCEVRSTGVDFIGIAARNAFTTINYTLPVTFELQDPPAGVVTPATVYVAKDGNLSLTTYKSAFERYGFTTYLDGVLFEEDTVPVTTEPRTVSFRFDGTAWYRLTFNTDGGTAVPPLVLNVGDVVPAIANPTKEGYEFTSWTPAIPAVMPAQDLLITASWTKIVPEGDIVVDGDTKKISVDDNRAELSKTVVDALKEGSKNVQLGVNGIAITMDTDSFGKLAGTGDLTVSVEKITGVKNQKVLDSLSESRKMIAEKAIVLDISFTTNGSTSDLGKVAFTVPYTLAPGQSADKIVVYYISDSGTLTEMTSSYSDGNLTVETTHFSTFAVCSESLTKEPDIPSGDNSKGSGGMNIGLIIGGAIGAIVLIGVIVFFVKKH